MRPVSDFDNSSVPIGPAHDEPPAAYVGMAVLDAQGVIIEVNDVWRAFGAANDADPTRAGVGVSYLDVCDRAAGDTGANEVGAAIRAVLRGATPRIDRVTIPCHSPTEQRWFDIFVAGRVDIRGRPIGATVMITPAVASQAVRDLDVAVVQAVIEASPDALVVCDADGCIVLANAQVEVLFGRDRNGLRGEAMETLVPERFRSAHLAHRGRYVARPTTRAMGEGSDLYGLRRDGTEFSVEIALSPLIVGDSTFTIATVRDVTARRAREAAERAVRRSLDLAHDGIVLIRSDTGAVSYANDGFRSLSGFRAEDLATVRVRELCPSLSIDALTAFVEPVLDGRETSVAVTTTLRRRDGRDVTIEAMVQCPIDDHGNRHHFLVVVRDIEERVRHDNELHVANATVALAEDRERIARDLHDHAIQRLFGCGLALAGISTQVLDGPAAQIEAVIDQLDLTIRDLRNAVFALSTTRAHDADVRAELAQVCNDAARIIGTRPVLVIRGPLDTTSAPTRTHLVAVLGEGLSNIARHAHATTVRVEVVMDNLLRMIISDDGIGFPPGSATLPGNGLRNLADRARALGGTFAITSSPGDGTTLSWIVPT